MGLSKRFKNIVVVVTVISLLLDIPAAAALTVTAESSTTRAAGTTLRLEKTEGTVSLLNKNDISQSILQGMRLFSGNKVVTGRESYAYVSLDSTTALKVSANSETEVKKSGKNLEILLKSGSMFFDVSAPLADDETLNIRTSTMVTGIRGTACSFTDLGNGMYQVDTYEGHMESKLLHPDTGEWVTMEFNEGERSIVDVSGWEDASAGSDLGASGQAAEFAVETMALTAEQIPPYIAVYIAENDNLMARLSVAGFDTDYIASNAAAMLAAEHQQSREAYADLEPRIARLPANVLVAPFVKMERADRSGTPGMNAAVPASLPADIGSETVVAEDHADPEPPAVPETSAIPEPQAPERSNSGNSSGGNSGGSSGNSSGGGSGGVEPPQPPVSPDPPIPPIPPEPPTQPQPPIQPEQPANFLIIEQDFLSGSNGFLENGVLTAAFAGHQTVTLTTLQEDAWLILPDEFTIPSGKVLRLQKGGIISPAGGTMLLNGSLANHGTVRVQGRLSADVLMQIDNFGLLVIEGRVDSAEGCHINNYSSITITNSGNAAFSDSTGRTDGTINNRGSIVNYGNMSYQDIGLTNSGSIANHGTMSHQDMELTNRGSIANYGNMNYQDMELTNSGSIANHSIMYYQDIALTNQGDIANEDGDLTFRTSMVNTNQALVNSDNGTITLEESMINASTAYAVNNKGTLLIEKASFIAGNNITPLGPDSGQLKDLNGIVLPSLPVLTLEGNFLFYQNINSALEVIPSPVKITIAPAGRLETGPMIINREDLDITLVVRGIQTIDRIINKGRLTLEGQGVLESSNITDPLIDNRGELVINGPYMIKDGVALCNSGSMTIHEGSVVAEQNNGIAVEHTAGELIIMGGTLSGQNSAVKLTGDGSIQIMNGILTSNSVSPTLDLNPADGGKVITISGGSIRNQFQGAGWTTTNRPDCIRPGSSVEGMIEVTNSAYRELKLYNNNFIGELNPQLAAMSTGESAAVIMGDVSADHTLAVPAGVTLEIYGGMVNYQGSGAAISSSGELILNGTTIDSKGSYGIEFDGDVTLNGATVQISGSDDNSAAVKTDTGTMKVEGDEFSHLINRGDGFVHISNNSSPDITCSIDLRMTTTDIEKLFQYCFDNDLVPDPGDYVDNGDGSFTFTFDGSNLPAIDKNLLPMQNLIEPLIDGDMLASDSNAADPAGLASNSNASASAGLASDSNASSPDGDDDDDSDIPDEVPIIDDRDSAGGNGTGMKAAGLSDPVAILPDSIDSRRRFPAEDSDLPVPSVD